ncbi:MAG TPA: sulfite exporter TauE/SafE family protein [Clostridiaceae bacterium]
MSIKKEKIKVFDMTCTSCEARVERAIKKIEGVSFAKASFSEQCVLVEYNNEVCDLEDIKASIKKAGYSTESKNTYKIVGIAIIALAIIYIGNTATGVDMNSRLTGATYFVLFFVGILTSIHCVGMCGGIMLSQSINKEGTNKFDSIKPAILYNLGRVLAYTILGGLVGALGSLFTLSLTLKSGMQIFAGVFMIIMGLNMSGFGLFRKINLKLPWSACTVKKKPKTPFLVGMLNGLMPCGPLQTMQLYALGTGSAFKGALSMFLFALGTVPLMLTFGALSGLLSKNNTKTILKFSGILVVVLGIIMGSRGLALAGVNIPSISLNGKGIVTNLSSAPAAAKPTIENGVQIIKMTADGNGYTPNGLYVQKNIPVKWIIDGKSINSCNGTIVIPSLNKQVNLKSGENIIEFTPKDKDISFSCGMGMIRGVIKVVDNIETVDTSKPDPSIPAPSSGMACCTGGTGTTTQTTSIYGSDITKVLTSRLIHKAVVAGNIQSIKIAGKGYEFEPLITVLNNGIKAKLSVDLSKFDTPEGTYTVVNLGSQETQASFQGKKGTVNVDLTLTKSDGYGIYKDGNILAVIEVVDDINKADLEAIRLKYLG